ncbi:MAG: glycosyltransferase family 2 protein [Patescibacteria group bacterium]
MNKPKISIILSTYNSSDTLSKTIDSVLSQSFTDFELIIINDASIDSTNEILKKYYKKDYRIIVISNDSNLGLTKNLNKGIKKAKGKYIARIDNGDWWQDINKLKEQVNFLEKNKDYILCGTQVKYIDNKNNVLGVSNFSITDRKIREHLLIGQGIFSHPTIMFRNKILYRDFFQYSQDLDLYIRLSFIGKLYCFKKYSVICRIDENGLTMKKKYYQRQYQNIAYSFFIERLKYKEDALDKNIMPKIRENKIELFLFNISIKFFIKYAKEKTLQKNIFLWLLPLIISFIFYPPLFIDYIKKIKRLLFIKIYNKKYKKYFNI